MELGLGLEEPIRRGARELIQKAIETELGELLSRYGNVSTLGGQRAIVRSGYLPERELLTLTGPAADHNVRFPGAMTEQMQIPDPPKFSDDLAQFEDILANGGSPYKPASVIWEITR